MQKYSFNAFHSRNINSGISYLLAYHQEFTLDKSRQKNFFSIGIEYLYHSFSFDSYYFKNDSVQLYNGKMDYNYLVRMNETGFPLLYKHNFSRENNDMSGIILSVGYVYRVMLPASVFVRYKGIKQENITIRPTFKVPVLSKYANSYAHWSIGYQKNNPAGKMKMYFEIYIRYGFSPFLIQTNYSANSLYFGNYFIGANIGIKWKN